MLAAYLMVMKRVYAGLCHGAISRCPKGGFRGSPPIKVIFGRHLYHGGADEDLKHHGAKLQAKEVLAKWQDQSGSSPVIEAQAL